MSNDWIPTIQETDDLPSANALLGSILRNCQNVLNGNYDPDYANNLLEGVAFDFVGLYAHMIAGNFPDDWS